MAVEQLDGRRLRWWEDKVDEMFVAAIIGAITCVAIWKGGSAGMTVAGTAIGGLCVYISGKVKMNGGGYDENH